MLLNNLGGEETVHRVVELELIVLAVPLLGQHPLKDYQLRVDRLLEEVGLRVLASLFGDCSAPALPERPLGPEVVSGCTFGGVLRADGDGDIAGSSPQDRGILVDRVAKFGEFAIGLSELVKGVVVGQVGGVGLEL